MDLDCGPLISENQKKRVHGFIHRAKKDGIPVLSIMAFEDEADAVKLANATEFGLVAGIWTRDGAWQMRVAKKMRCGQVFVNRVQARPIWLA